jgi:chemotaxis response regulator CheB
MERTGTVARDFPVVCIGGASADIDDYTDLIRKLPADLRIAIVIINHLSLVNDLLLEALPSCTDMLVGLIRDMMPVQPNHVYISPEERDLHIVDGVFRLKTISKPMGWPDVISVFLRSLARNWHGQLIAVIYAGYDGDGAAALSDVKGVGGITIAQRTEAAGQPDMPLSAIATGNVDFILSVEGIAKEIERTAMAAKAQVALGEERAAL